MTNKPFKLHDFVKKYFWLGLIVILYLFTRIYKIDSIPGSVYWDEASIGYNAYAITTDLKDEWGEFLPVHFRAFGEFKLPVYVYSVSILTKIFGVNTISLRLPSVLYTLGSIIFIYLLTLKITKEEKISLLSSFTFSILPWMFIFSRTGYEASAGLFFFLSFVYFLIFNEEKKINIFLSLFCAIASFYGYNSFRILTPLFFIAWVITKYLFKKSKTKNIKIGLLAIFVFIISLVPTMKLYYKDYGGVRLTTVGIKDPKTFVKNYFSHFSYEFLIKDGDTNDRSQVPGWGQVYLLTLISFIIGAVYLLREKNKNYWVLITFLLIGAIPAALTRESPHGLRSILLAPVFSIISSLGIYRFINIKVLKKYTKFILGGVTITYLLFFGQYFFDFVINYNLKTAESWQYQYKDLFQSIGNFNNKDKIVISDEFAQPYIFALYYLKFSPKEFRQTVKYNPVDKWGFSTVSEFGNFEFKNLKNEK